MNSEEQIQLQQELEQYLQEHNIYPILQGLLQQVIQKQPPQLLDFLIQRLQAPTRTLLFVIGPPGLSINSALNSALNSFPAAQQYQLFNCGEQIGKIVSTLDDHSKQDFHECRIISDATAMDHILTKIKALPDRSCIIEGYPKTLAQAVSLQHCGVIPTRVLFVNIDEQGLQKLCRGKLEQQQAHLTPSGLDRAVKSVASQYQINLKALKQFYSHNCMEIDVSQDSSHQHVLQLLKKNLLSKVARRTPCVSAQVIVIGSPLSGRTTLGKKIAAQYDFVYISTSMLIAEEIRRDTIHGRKMKDAFLKHQLIELFLIEKLIEDRISKKDCKMQGFVLEGYPKDKTQFDSMKNIRINPTLIVALDCPIEVAQGRMKEGGTELSERFQKWNEFSKYLKSHEEEILFIDPTLPAENMFEEVAFELEKW